MIRSVCSLLYAVFVHSSQPLTACLTLEIFGILLELMVLLFFITVFQVSSLCSCQSLCSLCSLGSVETHPHMKNKQTGKYRFIISSREIQWSQTTVKVADRVTFLTVSVACCVRR